jgi:hypothetical protein
VADHVAGRAYANVYRVTGRADIHEFLISAVERAGGTVLFASEYTRAPVYLGIQVGSDERLGVLVYPFRMNQVATRNRPADEVRGQLRYGSEESWAQDHALGRDISGVDITLILGVDIDNDIFVGLDPQLYELLPMGISFYAKAEQVERTRTESWHVWEKENRPGKKRVTPRSPTHLETLVGFAPERLIDYARFERRASDLGLDPALRYAAAVESAKVRATPDQNSDMHALEEQFALTSQEIMEIISNRNRLTVAVRGGVAEHHLERQLRQHPAVREVESLDVDAMHDFNVLLTSGRVIRVECKNASPSTFANGDYKVEVQKTRASKNDPASRFYRTDSFDVVAACLYSPTGSWDFRFAATADLTSHKDFADRLTPIQHIDERWAQDLLNVVERVPQAH